MPESPLLPQTPLQRPIAQLALDLARQVRGECHARAARPNPRAVREPLLLTDGRPFLRDSLAATLQQQAAAGEKKGGPRGPVRADRPAAPKALAGAKS